ncbi:lipoprotein 17-related variable surface protein [Mycoplasmopsis primatum]|uniref:lipoprotein 17-related variable surface protein n=1 Tax=Mycoplasmopsis primatum TaxID=55604 RepID=UPI000497C058|nr:lipoprotein 17-related variable surface protein [Mycoplasmopsis primatum]
MKKNKLLLIGSLFSITSLPVMAASCKKEDEKITEIAKKISTAEFIKKDAQKEETLASSVTKDDIKIDLPSNVEINGELTLKAFDTEGKLQISGEIKYKNSEETAKFSVEMTGFKTREFTIDELIAQIKADYKHKVLDKSYIPPTDTEKEYVKITYPKGLVQEGNIEITSKEDTKGTITVSGKVKKGEETKEFSVEIKGFKVIADPHEALIKKIKYEYKNAVKPDKKKEEVIPSLVNESDISFTLPAGIESVKVIDNSLVDDDANGILTFKVEVTIKDVADKKQYEFKIYGFKKDPSLVVEPLDELLKHVTASLVIIPGNTKPSQIKKEEITDDSKTSKDAKILLSFKGINVKLKSITKLEPKDAEKKLIITGEAQRDLNGKHDVGTFTVTVDFAYPPLKKLLKETGIEFVVDKTTIDPKTIRNNEISDKKIADVKILIKFVLDSITLKEITSTSYDETEKILTVNGKAQSDHDGKHEEEDFTIKIDFK